MLSDSTTPYYTTQSAFPGDSGLILGVVFHSHDLSGHLRQLTMDDLRVVAVHSAECEAPNLALTNAIEAEYGVSLTKATWWVTDVLPAIRKEIDRRNRPAQPHTGNSPITRMKALDIYTVAAKFTALQKSGPGKFKGCCPIHKEKSPSFYINEERQSWHCFGACGTGGDVVTLLKLLKAVK